MGRYRSKKDYVREEKEYQSAIWKGFLAFCLLLLLYTVYHHSKELITVFTGTAIICEYEEGNIPGQAFAVAKYKTDNQIYYFDLEGYAPVIKNNTVTLYYTEQISQAIPRNRTSSWLRSYILFGGISVLSIWKIRKIYKEPSYLYDYNNHDELFI